MKTITSDFKNTVKMFGRELDSKISYELNGETIELGSEELNSVTPHYEGSLLKSVMKCLELDSNVDIPLETILSYEFGVKVNGEYEYINFGNYVVYSSEKQEDTGSYKIICYDKLLYSMKEYEDMGLTYPIAIRSYLNAICTHLGLTFKNASDTFANYNKVIPNELYLDSDGYSLGYTFRDVLDEIAQATGSTICVNEQDDELEIRYVTETNDTINEYYLKDINVNFGEKYGPINSIVLSRAEESDNVYLRDETSVAQNGLCEIKIKDNQIMNSNDRSDYLPDILNQLNGLEYYLNDFSSTGITYYDLCDMYNIQIGEETYNCLMLNDEILITQGLEENIHTDLLETSETDYTKADKTDRRINQTYIMVDKQNGVIQELASKVIDISESISGIGQVQLNNAFEGGLHKLSIKGAISLLYPRSQDGLYGYPLFPRNGLVPKDGLVPSINYPYPTDLIYPNENLFTKNMILMVDDNEYKLDINFLNYINNSICDEFIFEEGKCKIIRRVGIDSEGNLYALDEEVEEIRDDITILVKANSVIKLKSFGNAILTAEYLTENDYTEIFATQVNVQSDIQQTAESIISTVSAEYETIENANREYSEIRQTTDSIETTVSHKVGDNEVVSKINQSPESITINANKISLAGKTLNLTSDNMAINSTNFKVTSAGAMTCSNASITGGGLNITNTASGVYPIMINRTSGGINFKSYVNEMGIRGYANSTLGYVLGASDYGFYFQLCNNGGSASIQMLGSDGSITCVSLTQTSLKENKKNFEKFDNALDIIKDIDIYKYNMNTESDEHKKHIGFVIGEGYNYSSEITAIDKDNKEIGVDLYSMISVCMQAIKEQQKEIEDLKARIKALEKEE